MKQHMASRKPPKISRHLVAVGTAGLSQVKQATSLTCSAGIGPNRALAVARVGHQLLLVGNFEPCPMYP